MSLNRRKLIRLAEYVAVSASAVGAVVTLMTQKPAYAVIPLSVTTALSLVSREERSQHSYSKLALAPDTDEQIAAQLDPITQNQQQVHQRLDVIGQQGLGRQQQLDVLIQAAEQRDTHLTAIAQTIQTMRSDLSAQMKALLEDQQKQHEETADLRSQLQSQQDTFAQQSVVNQEQLDIILNRWSGLDRRIETFEHVITDIQKEVASLRLQSAKSISDESALPSSEFSDAIPVLPVGDNFDLDINLGIDFGTGYTKICFRDIARECSEVVTFTSPKPSGLTLKETLIPTRLALLEDGTLLTGLTVAEWAACDLPIQKEINYIKMRLAAIDMQPSNSTDEWRIEQIPELDDDQTVESLCIYYLSEVIKRSQAWIIQNRPELFANQSVRWSANLGVPVEYCDSPALKRFERVLETAWLLVNTSVETAALTIDRLNALVAHLHQWAAQNKPGALDCTTTPEIAAAVWSFLNSRQAQEGFYTFFDIGDGTLDGAAFIFRQDEGDRQVDFYSGHVKPLGVTAFVEKTAEELSLSSEHVRASLSGTDNEQINQQMQQSKTRHAVQRLVAEVIMDGNEKHLEIRRHSVPRDIGDKLKVFVGGGGGNTDFFPAAIQETHRDFNQESADIPPYEIRHIPAPSDLTINGLDAKDFNRFAIAYGLCIPDGEGPTIQLPSQFNLIDSVTELTTQPINRYEDSRDAT